MKGMHGQKLKKIYEVHGLHVLARLGYCGGYASIGICRLILCVIQFLLGMGYLLTTVKILRFVILSAPPTPLLESAR